MKFIKRIQRILSSLNDQPSTVRQFGQARLVKHSNGQHELLGGTVADRAIACEWVSLFAHEIVFKVADAALRRPKTIRRGPARPPQVSGFRFQNPVLT